jgi:hypothetical protein
MLCSWRLWVSVREFPLVPIARWYPVLPEPWDRIFLGMLLASLVVALRFYKPAVTFFLAGAFFLALGDQNRFQAWFYLYAVMLFLTLFEERVALAACRVAVSTVYVWSGLQKFNQRFFDEVVPFFVEPAGRWLSPGWIALLQALIASAGVVELLIGIALWIRPLRRVAIAAAFLVHLTALLLLGPLGREWNLAVWPWNITMPLLVLVLFAPARIPHALPALRISTPALACILLFALLPTLSYFGAWDSSLSFCLYSGNTARADFLVTPALFERLPERMRRWMERTERGELSLNVMRWAVAEIGTPPLAEPRNFRALARYVARYAPTDHDLRLVVAPRYGPSKEYRQSDLR